MAKGCIYIMTNPCLANMVKIGYAADVEERRRQLSTTALPYPYEIFATYETPGKLEDKRLHKLIDRGSTRTCGSRKTGSFLSCRRRMPMNCWRPSPSSAAPRTS